MEPSAISNRHFPVSQFTSTVTAPILPHLQHFPPEQLASPPQIDGETFPYTSFIESSRESHKSHMSLRSSPCSPDTMLRDSPPSTSMSSEEITEVKLHTWTTPSPKRTKQPSSKYSSPSYSAVREDFLKYKLRTTSPDTEQKLHRARNRAAEVDESKKRPLTYPTPDYSKVEPKVRFPKVGYKPPKSRRSSRMESMSHDGPLVFKSTADIVKEGLLRIFSISDPDKPPVSAHNFTVPQEFKCHPRAAIMLFEQLEDDFTTLLIKRAEVKNTIDLLRMNEKVNLYSNPPKPGHMVQSGLNHKASGFIKMDFPQAQRAEINSASLHPNTHSTDQESSSACSSTTSPEPQVEEHPARILCSQADKLIQQMQTFKNLLECQKLKHFEQMKGLSEFAEELDSLERGYLSVKKGKKLLQQGGGEISPFDPERELENLIFQCGLHLDELKEQVDQMGQEQPTSEAPPSPLLEPSPASVSSEVVETLSHPQVNLYPVPSKPNHLVQMGLNHKASRFMQLDFPQAQRAEISSACLHPNTHSTDEESSSACSSTTSPQPQVEDQPARILCNQADKFIQQMQTFQNLLECKKLNHFEQVKCFSLLTDELDSLEREYLLAKKEQKLRLQGRTKTIERELENLIFHCGLHLDELREQVDPMGKEQLTSEAPPSPFLEPTPAHVSSQAGETLTHLQDGFISLEIDSGFASSESSRQTPAATPSPLYQRSSETSVDQLRDVSSRRREAYEHSIRQTWRRPHCVHRQRKQPDSLITSVSTTPQPLVSRCTQTSTAAPESSPESCSAHTRSVHRKTHRQHPAVSVQVSKPAAEPGTRSRAVPLCPQCLSRQRGQLKGPAGDQKPKTRSTCCHHCPACGRPERCRNSEEDSRRLGDSPTCKCRQPVKIPDLGLRSKGSATPPTLLQLMEVCPTPLQLYSVPRSMPSGNISETSSVVEGHEKTRTGVKALCPLISSSQWTPPRKAEPSVEPVT